MTSQRPPSDEFLRAELRRAAGEHRPDRTLIRNRIASNRAAADRQRGRRWRMAGSAAAVVALLGLGGVARWASADQDGGRRNAAKPPAQTAGRPSTAQQLTAEPQANRSTSATKRPTSRPPTSMPPKGRPGNTRVEQGPMRSDGSIGKASSATDGRCQVTVKLSEPITKLVVTLRVVLTPGLTDQGTTHKVPHASITGTVTAEPKALVYRFVLAKGDTLPAGTYVFTGHYSHDRGRDAGGDTYEATATSTAGRQLDVYGNFHAVS